MFLDVKRWQHNSTAGVCGRILEKFSFISCEYPVTQSRAENRQYRFHLTQLPKDSRLSPKVSTLADAGSKGNYVHFFIYSNVSSPFIQTHHSLPYHK